MAECTDCGNKKKDCGCTNEGLTINDVCNPIVCESDECSESFPAGCIIYSGKDIVCDDIVIVTAGNTLAQAVANITAYFCNALEPKVYGLYTQTADSTPVVDPVVGSLVGAGVGSLTIPANTFQVGDSFRAKLSGHITCSNTQELTIVAQDGNGNTLFSTGFIDLKTSTDGNWNLEVDFTIRSLGVTGGLVSAGVWSYVPNAAGQSIEGSDFSTVGTLDTTINNTLEIIASFNLDEGGANTIYSELFTITKMY